MACITKAEYLDQIKAKYPAVTQDELNELARIFDDNNGNLDNIVDHLNTLNDAAKPFIMPEFIPYTPAKAESTIIDPISLMMLKANHYASRVVVAGIIPFASRNTPIVFEKFDTWATNNIPLYTDAKDVITDAWEGNEFIQQLKFYVNQGGVGSLFDNLNKISSAAHAAKQDSIKLMDESAQELDIKLRAAYDEEAIVHLDKVVAKSGIFALAKNTDLLELVESKVTLDELIKRYEDKVGHKKVVAENLSKVYTHQDLSGIENVRQNTSQYNISTDKNEIEALASLYALKSIDRSVELLQNMYTQHKDLYDSLISLSIAVDTMNERVYKETGDTSISRGNHIDDIASVDYDVIPVTAEEWGGEIFNESRGWKELRAPSSTGKFGLIYREAVGNLQEGTGTNISYIKTGIPLQKGHFELKKYYDNSTENGFINEERTDGSNTKVLALTQEEMDTLKFHNDPVKSLLRAYAHKKLLLETNKIRNVLLDGFTYNAENKTLDVINSELKYMIKNNIHPVFIKLPTDIKLDHLDKEIKQKFRSAKKSILSDVSDFKNKVTLVRKDVGYMVEGFKEGNLFKNYKLNYYLEKLTDLIKYIKTNTIILNPAKIMMDAISSTTLVLSKGTSMQEVFTYGKEAVKLSGEMTELRNERLALQLQLDSLPDSTSKDALKEKLEKLNEEIKNHPFSPALANGFIQSLGTEMLSKERESLRGLQVEIDKVITKLTELPTGERTKLAKLVMRAAKFGLNGESVYLFIGDQLKKFEGTKSIGNIVSEVGEDLKRLKSNDDVKGYMGMMIGTPNSTFVRLGGALTLYADLVPRWILYRHNINNNMSEKEAVQDALTTFLDYKVQMPPALKFMSDLYLMPFPSYFLRIQRVILTMIEKNPVSFASNLAVNELIGAHGQNILSSSLFTKWSTDSIFTNPFDLIRPANMVPYIHVIPGI